MKVSRRDLLAGAAGVVALGRTAVTQAPADPSKVRGKPSRALGQRAPTEKPVRQPRGATSSGTPHQDLYGTITPADLHFERHHGGVPEIDPNVYSLLIHGMVERPMVFTLADLKRFPAVSRVHFWSARAISAAAGPRPTSRRNRLRGSRARASGPASRWPRSFAKSARARKPPGSWLKARTRRCSPAAFRSRRRTTMR